MAALASFRHPSNPSTARTATHSQLCSPRPSSLDTFASPLCSGPSSFGAEQRFLQQQMSLVRSSFAPSPVAYEASHCIGRRCPDSQHSNARAIHFGRPPPPGLSPRHAIRLSLDDRAQPLPAALSRTLSRNASRVIDLFRSWGADGAGVIDKAEFRAAVRRMGLPADGAAADATFDAWDADGRGELSLAQLQSILRRSPRAGGAAGGGGEARREAEGADLKVRKPSAARQALLLQLAERLDKQPTLLAEWRERYALGRDTISRPGFRRLLRSLKVAGEVEEINGLFDMLDPTGEGFIVLRKLEAALRWVHKSRNLSLVRGKEMVFRSEQQFFDWIGAAFKANAPRVIELFREYDINDDGVVQRGEFKKALPLLGMMLGNAEADKLFEWFDKDRSDTITFDEFFRIIKHQRVKKAEGPAVVEESWANVDEVRADVTESFCKLRLPAKDDREVGST
ncbi:hypothetical protein AB1Y20_017196 [Prymnesium parvum]|uniref:EF-hand domain-containing protein n=1 Tax=Prymnesium parvum TaxID=97485 RepID=A0AB34I9B5_PRYPA